MVRPLESNVEKMQTKCGKAIERFLSTQRENTATAYRGDIKRFIKIMFNGKTMDTITSEELDTFEFDPFIDYIETFENVSNNTINRHISTIKELYKYLKARSIIKSDISYLEFVEALDKDGVEITPMPIEVVDRYISEVGRDKYNPEVKQKLIKLAADQGLRMVELLNLTWRSFTPREDGVIMSGYGKRNKKFIKVISHEVYKDLLELRKEASLDSKVFAPLSPKNVTDMMIRLRNELGYKEEGYSFHSLRKSAVTYEHKWNGGDIIKTQRFAGHSNPNTTQIYIEAGELTVSGMFSTRNNDPNAYRRITHEELLKVIEEDMSEDFKHLLNAKIQQKNK